MVDPLYLLSLLLTFMLVVLVILGYALQRLGNTSQLVDRSRISAQFCPQCGLPIEADSDQCRACGMAIQPRFHTH